MKARPSWEVKGVTRWAMRTTTSGCLNFCIKRPFCLGYSTGVWCIRGVGRDKSCGINETKSSKSGTGGRRDSRIQEFENSRMRGGRVKPGLEQIQQILYIQ